jgi:hypothetical protein
MTSNGTTGTALPYSTTSSPTTISFKVSNAKSVTYPFPQASAGSRAIKTVMYHDTNFPSKHWPTVSPMTSVPKPTNSIPTMSADCPIGFLAQEQSSSPRQTCYQETRYLHPHRRYSTKTLGPPHQKVTPTQPFYTRCLG